MSAPGPEQHVFVLRAVRGPLGATGIPPEWRFWIEHIPSGAQRHYRTFAGVLEFVATHLPAEAFGSVVGPGTE
jgi:hypothetical protein